MTGRQQSHSPHELDDHELFQPVMFNNRPVLNRLFYPVRQHQEEFDEIERRLGHSPFTPVLGLNNLTDEGTNPPPHTLAVIIKCAILGSPHRRLTLREIRIAMCRRFAYYSMREDIGWCNTIRHTLSTDPSFQIVHRPGRTSDDSGNWWKLAQNAEYPDVTPTQGRSRRPAQAGVGSSRTRSQGIPTSRRRREQEPWTGMTTMFPTSEAQDLEDLENIYASQNPANQQHGEHARGYYIPVASASTSSAYPQHPAGATAGLAGSSARGGHLPGIHSLGILELGRSGSRSHQVHSQLSTNVLQQTSHATYRDTRSEVEDSDEETHDNI